MTGCRLTYAEDLPALARCHARAFPRALSTRHGPALVMKMLEWYMVAERGVLCHYDAGGRVAGYFGAIRTPRPGMPGAFTSIAQYAFWPFVAGYLRRPWLLLHPQNLRKRSGIQRNVLLRLGLTEANARVSPASAETGQTFRSYWGLVVIAVDPEFQGKGVGRALLDEFEDRARADGVSLVRLSVNVSNTGAIAFYERNGWSRSAAIGDAINMHKELR